MAEIKSRIQLKHDTEAHWQLATGFTPKAGEMIVYDADANNPVRYKIGDGTTNINALPFATGTAVLYTSQDIDEDQQKQALINLGLSTEDIEGLKVIEAVTADKVAKKLIAGNKTYDGSTDVTISAADFGLEQAMKFLGTTTTDISDASDMDTVIIGSGTVKVEAGNVVLYNGYEYVWTGSAWEQLGQEGSFVLKSITINGKALNDNITLTAADVDAYSKAEIDTALSSKSDTGHTHSLADINEVEVTTSTETVYEKTITANSNITTVGNFPFNKVRHKKAIVTLNGVEYDGEYSISFEGAGSESLKFGDYTISQPIVEGYPTLRPTIPGETYEIKVDVIETTTIIPDDYISENIVRTSELDALQTVVAGKADSSTTLAGYGITDAYTKTEIDTAFDAKVDKVSGKGLSTNDYTTAEKEKLAGIEENAQKNTITGVKGNSESTYRTGDVNITKADIGLGNVDNTSDANKPVSTAQQTAIDTALASAKQYTDEKITTIEIVRW